MTTRKVDEDPDETQPFPPSVLDERWNVGPPFEANRAALAGDPEDREQVDELLSEIADQASVNSRVELRRKVPRLSNRKPQIGPRANGSLARSAVLFRSDKPTVGVGWNCVNASGRWRLRVMPQFIFYLNTSYWYQEGPCRGTNPWRTRLPAYHGLE